MSEEAFLTNVFSSRPPMTPGGVALGIALFAIALGAALLAGSWARAAKRWDAKPPAEREVEDRKQREELRIW